MSAANLVSLLELIGYIYWVPWTIILVSEMVEWFEGLDAGTAEQVAAALDLLEEHGPALGRPLVDTLSGSAIFNLKELRPGSSGKTEIRILFAFDPARQAIVLTGGDKSGRWKAWYKQQIPVAEERFKQWLDGNYSEEE